MDCEFPLRCSGSSGCSWRCEWGTVKEEQSSVDTRVWHQQSWVHSSWQGGLQKGAVAPTQGLELEAPKVCSGSFVQAKIEQ